MIALWFSAFSFGFAFAVISGFVSAGKPISSFAFSMASCFVIFSFNWINSITSPFSVDTVKNVIIIKYEDFDQQAGGRIHL